MFSGCITLLTVTNIKAKKSLKYNGLGLYFHYQVLWFSLRSLMPNTQSPYDIKFFLVVLLLGNIGIFSVNNMTCKKRLKYAAFVRFSLFSNFSIVTIITVKCLKRLKRTGIA